jgi:cytochrome c oxidase subunit 3
MTRLVFVALVATVMMLFTAFAAAYMERAGARGWERFPLPGILWASTALLLLSSVAAEAARRSGTRLLLHAALLLGVLFLGGQILAWRELRAQGVYLPTTPYASFVYLFTAVHAFHVVAALLALLLALFRPRLLGPAALFWHFLAALWLYILLILKVLG